MSERAQMHNAHICEYMPNNFQIVLNNDYPYLLEVKFSGDNSYRELAVERPITFCPWCGERILHEEFEHLKYFSASDVFPDESAMETVEEEFEEEVVPQYDTVNSSSQRADSVITVKNNLDDLYGSITSNAQSPTPIRKPTFDFSGERHRMDG